MHLSWVQFLMLFPFLECLHNRRKEGIIYELHPYHSYVLYERMKPDSWIILGDFSDSLWTIFFFLKSRTFSPSKTRKMRIKVMRAEVMTFTFLLSLNREVASDTAHGLHGPQAVRMGTRWISERSLSISRWISFFMLFLMLWMGFPGGAVEKQLCSWCKNPPANETQET